MHNFILDPFQDELGGVNLNTEFKNVLKAIREIDKGKTESEKTTNFLYVLYGDAIANIKPDENYWFKLAGFIQGDIEKWKKIKQEHDEELRREKQGKKKAKDKKKLFDYEVDSKEIYTSFLLAYKIDLRKESLHWCDFVAMLDALPKDTPLKSKMEVRGWKPSKGDSDEYKAHMKSLQNELSLEENEDEGDSGCLSKLMR